jgi:hypothetical protein
MALKRLISEEMLQVSNGWIAPGAKGSKAILACPELAPLHPRLTAVHEGLAAVTQPTVTDPRLKKISEEEAEADGRHDEVIRGSHMLLTGISLLLGLGPDSATILATRDNLLPDGLESVNKTYRAEAGQAAQLSDRMGDLEPVLKNVIVGGTTPPRPLTHYVAEWIALGAKLGQLEDERARIQATPSVVEGGSAVVDARNRWIRTANALLATAEMAELDPKVMAAIFGPMWAAEKTADRRGRPPVKPEAGPGTNEPTA